MRRCNYQAFELNYVCFVNVNHLLYLLLLINSYPPEKDLTGYIGAYLGTVNSYPLHLRHYTIKTLSHLNIPILMHSNSCY